MKPFLLTLFVLSSTGLSAAQEQAPLESVKAETEATLDTNPASSCWADVRPTYAEVDANGRHMSEYRTEVRSRWTKDNLYFLFVPVHLPFTKIFTLTPPNVMRETYGLWKWNVAEVFIGSDFHDIKRYKEFELSPQNEWVNLDINLNAAPA